MPPKSPQLDDAVEATPRARMTRSALSRGSLASAATSSNRPSSVVVDLTGHPVAVPHSAGTPSRPNNESLRTGRDSSRSQSSSNITVEVPVPRSKIGRPPSKLASSQSMSKLRKRTDETPASAASTARARTQSSISHLRTPSSATHSVRSSLASTNNEDTSGYADCEPIKTYLRIRPPQENAKREQASPYIEVVSDTEVLMHPPKEADLTNARTAARARTHSTASATKYIFSKVFPPDTASPKGPDAQRDSGQAAFFRDTTLPMVEDLLNGQSGLIFTYGVTNSGKSYTVMGSGGPGEAGILPRTLDVIFNSIKGLESKTDIRPIGLSGIERVDASKGAATHPASVGIDPFLVPGLTKKLFDRATSRSLKVLKAHDHDSTKLPVDRNQRYSVWVSYVEVYNEKLFDLLDGPPRSNAGSSSGLARSESTRGSNWSIATTAAGSSDAAGNYTLKRRALSLKGDSNVPGKYVAGLREVKVNSATEARDFLVRGQENRAVFGTNANRVSSRSHGIFTIKLIREHGGVQYLQNEGDGDLSSGSYNVARLSIVDLAGSERLANTGLTSGDRLKEAGNINKSLMVLGQCFEILRQNQSRASFAQDAVEGPMFLSTSQPRLPTAASSTPPKKRQSLVPFRHSKLTELFQNFLAGEGKTVMIVNANPYDTGFDENSHVMKFSAVAKEVGTTRAEPAKAKAMPRKAMEVEVPPPKPVKRGPGRPRKGAPRDSQRDTHASELSEVRDITIVEVDESDDEDESDPFVDMLVEKHEELRQKLYASELRCALIEKEIREEMADEMEQRLLEMQSRYNQRLAEDAEQNEQFVNRKIDLLVRSSMAQEKQVGASKPDSDDSELSELSSSGGSDLDDDEQGTSRANGRQGSSESDSGEDEDQSVIVRQSQALDGNGESESDDDGVEAEANSDESDQDDDEEDEDEVENELELAATRGNKKQPRPVSDSDSSFASEASSDEAQHRPSKRRTSNPTTKTKTKARSSRTSTNTGRSGRGALTRTPLWERNQDASTIALSDMSDASMIAEDCVTPKPKRKLRKKAAVQEDDMVDQIGDSSVVEIAHPTGLTTLLKSRRSVR
ncbi:uncharacterized protein PFL1_04429 [Pseudozyma flocculosa PF-1]|uniref:Related to Kinesin-like protein KIF23 n=2 Tax=Pseudozyma flocculosa TaxID=84751 RepID=A0A5C3FCA2_9BASI|nr:uncharacterized protein PFL1_04429 [Pseudozyma flocculosa PF-1]EPQ28102.1 hypothetical protein PFL1_04429 [Pseudozyma flocculosa PF-1]SPO41900.1 related to Kinesin-like protein KIF23 [Pseudozyma flocculosa]